MHTAWSVRARLFQEPIATNHSVGKFRREEMNIIAQFVCLLAAVTACVNARKSFSAAPYHRFVNVRWAHTRRHAFTQSINRRLDEQKLVEIKKNSFSRAVWVKLSWLISVEPDLFRATGPTPLFATIEQIRIFWILHQFHNFIYSYIWIYISFMIHFYDVCCFGFERNCMILCKSMENAWNKFDLHSNIYTYTAHTHARRHQLSYACRKYALSNVLCHQNTRHITSNICITKIK